MLFRFTTIHCNVVPIDHIPLSWIYCVPSLISSSLLSSNVHLVPFLDISCIDCSLWQQSIALSLISSSLLSSIVYLVPFLDIVFFILVFFLCLSLMSNVGSEFVSHVFQERTPRNTRLLIHSGENNSKHQLLENSWRTLGEQKISNYKNMLETP